MGLGLVRAGRPQRGVSRSVGVLLLVMAASGAVLYVIRATGFGQIFTDWTRPVPEALVFALPFYLALLGMTVPAIPISLLLNRRRLGPSSLRAASIVAAILGAVAFGVMTIAAYDSMWVMYMGPFGLDAPPARPLLPQEVFTIASTVGPAFIGAWIALTSLQLGAGGASRALCVLGGVTGAAIIATMPYAWDLFAAQTLLPMELTLSMLWAAALGIYFVFARRIIAMA